MTDKIRVRILYLMRILQEETDEVHPLSIPQIIGMLKGYGIDADRRAIYNDLEALRTYGLDIIYQKGKHHDYYIGNRIFELPELKLLADEIGAAYRKAAAPYKQASREGTVPAGLYRQPGEVTK